jgi:hypothetical protein
MTHHVQSFSKHNYSCNRINETPDGFELEIWDGMGGGKEKAGMQLVKITHTALQQMLWLQEQHKQAHTLIMGKQATDRFDHECAEFLKNVDGSPENTKIFLAQLSQHPSLLGGIRKLLENADSKEEESAPISLYSKK